MFAGWAGNEAVFRMWDGKSCPSDGGNRKWGRTGLSVLRRSSIVEGWAWLPVLRGGVFTVYQLAFPLVHERPVDSTGAEVSHVQVGFESGDRLVEQRIVFAEDGPVAGQ